jgi:anti-sigma B factor antagonist
MTDVSLPVPEFECDVRETADQAVVRLSGELDIATTPEVEEVLRRVAAAKREVVLDLSGLDFMDSTGLRMTIELNALARQDGCHFIIVRGNDQVHRIFEMSGVEEHLTLVDEAPAPQ